MVDSSRWFLRQYPHGVITDEMKELPHSELLEYAGQMYRRLDRIIAVLDRAENDAECEHTMESVMRGVGRQASTEFDRRCLGYNLDSEDYEDNNE